VPDSSQGPKAYESVEPYPGATAPVQRGVDLSSTLDTVLAYATAAHARSLTVFDSRASQAGTLMSTAIAALLALVGAATLGHIPFQGFPLLMIDLALALFVLAAAVAGWAFFGRTPDVPDPSDVLGYQTEPSNETKAALATSLVGCYNSNLVRLKGLSTLFELAIALSLAALAFAALGSVLGA
jgi:hypothetical protein